jgi:hypothetical protein
MIVFPYSDTVLDSNGAPVSDALVQVNNKDGSPASLYQADGVTPVANPQATNVSGGFTLYLVGGLYDLVVSKAGFDLPAEVSNVRAGDGRRVVVTAAESPYSVQVGDAEIIEDCTTGPVSIVFLSAASASARRLRCKKIDATANLVLHTPQPGETVEGEAVSYDSNMPGEFMEFSPDGVSAWNRIG